MKPSLSPSPKSYSRSWTVGKQRSVKGHTCSIQASFLHPTNSCPKFQWWLGIWWYREVWWGWREMQDLGGKSAWHATRVIAWLFFRISTNQPLPVARLWAESSSSFNELTVPILSSWAQNFLQKLVLVTDPTRGCNKTKLFLRNRKSRSLCHSFILCLLKMSPASVTAQCQDMTYLTPCWTNALAQYLIFTRNEKQIDMGDYWNHGNRSLTRMTGLYTRLTSSCKPFKFPKVNWSTVHLFLVLRVHLILLAMLQTWLFPPKGICPLGKGSKHAIKFVKHWNTCKKVSHTGY